MDKVTLEALQLAAETLKTARRYFPKSIRNTDKYQLESTCATISKAIQEQTLRNEGVDLNSPDSWDGIDKVVLKEGRQGFYK